MLSKKFGKGAKETITSKRGLSVRQQYQLLMIHRSRIYYVEALNDDSIIANEISEVYREFPIADTAGYERCSDVKES